jgi:WD40 repeat protein
MKNSLPVTLLFITCATQAVADEKFPPGWLPLSLLDDQPTWSEVREIKDRIHLYLPDGDKPVRGVFACFVFHSGAYGPNGRFLASCGEDKTARIWDARSGKAIQVMKGHADHLTAIACSPDGQRIAVASKEVITIHTLACKVD